MLALKLFIVAHLHLFINSVDNTKSLCYTLPLMQHYLLPIFAVLRGSSIKPTQQYYIERHLIHHHKSCVYLRLFISVLFQQLWRSSATW